MNRFGSLAAALVMCMTASSFAQTVKLSMQVGGKTRTCMVHVPSRATKAPLVFFVHGANGSGAAFESETKGDATADREKFIAAYPSASSDGSTGTSTSAASSPALEPPWTATTSAPSTMCRRART